LQLIPNLKHGDFFLPYDPRLVDFARNMRKNPTPAERKLWGYLRTFPFRFWRQRPIDRFIVDFYCPKLKLVIEVDGESHYTNEGITSDLERTAILESYDLQVVRFQNSEVLQSFEEICKQIEAFVTISI
jgi:very-short-patch-repair endonuclease